MATYTYDDFRVTLTPRAVGGYDVRAVGPDGTGHAGVFEVPFPDDELERAVLGVARRRGPAARSAGVTTRDVGGAGPPALDAEQLGGALAAALLAGDVAVAYDDARRRAASAGRGLRLSLSLTAAPRLLSVPWELLYRRPRFLANQRQTPLVRHLDTPGLPQPPAIDETVRLLGVVASPRDCASLDVAGERVRVERAIAKVAAMGRVELDWLEPATPRRLREALRDGIYHVLHFVGHSDFTAEGEGVLFLEGPDGDHAAVDSTELANLLADQTTLRLVVLNSCEGARTTLTDPYAGVATTLVQLGVPAVVAMQFEISDAAAILFAEELYTNLVGRQDPIDAAVAEARKAIYIELGGVEWATPVLFMGDVDVELFRFRVVAAPLPPPPPPDAPTERREAPPSDVGPDRVEVERPRRPRTRRLVAAVTGLVLLGGALYGVNRVLDTSVDPGAAPASTLPSAPATATSTGQGPTATPGGLDPGGPPPPPAEAATFAGVIDGPDTVIEHPVALTAGQVVYLAGSGTCGPTVEYRLRSPSGAQLGGAPYVCDDLGRVEVSETGPHEVVVQGFAGGTGSYRIELTPVPNDVTVAVDVGASLRGEIVAPGERRLFTFAGGARDVVYLRGDGPCGANVAYRVLSPSGVQLGGAPYVCDDLGRIELAETGVHTVSVDSWSGGFGVYDLALLPVAPDVATAVVIGDTLAGEIASAGEHDPFVFPASSGNVVELIGTGPCGVNVFYRLLTPSGVQLGGAPYACDDLGRVELPETGEYTVSIESWSGGAGPYEIQLLPA